MLLKFYGLSTVLSKNRNFRYSRLKLSLNLLLEYILQDHGVESCPRTVIFIEFVNKKTFC